MIKFLFLFLILLSSQAWATTFYVRTDGSNATNCTGTTNAAYVSGTGQPCAFSNPAYALGSNCGNGGGSCGVAGLMSGSDTLSIDGDDPLNGGAQAQYEIGYGSSAMSTCTNGSASECTLGEIPAGSSGNPTSIIGTGTHRPQIYAPTFPWEAINAQNDYITLQNLEIATHQTCGYSSPDTTCTNGEGSNRTSDGILIAGTGITLTDIWVHGFSRFGIVTGTMNGTNNFTRVWIIGNSYGGFSLGNNDTSSNTGTLVWNQPIVEWNGCLEVYPLTSGIDAPADHKYCYGQDSNGYGDGISFGPTGSQNAGNWTITGPGSISFNTQDGFDTLHGSGNGTMQIDKMRFEGNAGQQIKMNGINSYLTNSVIFGDCGWWYGSANSGTGAMQPGDVCRANGDTVLFNVTNNSVTRLYNNTFLSNAIAWESKDFNSTGCNQSGGSGTQIYATNNIVLGGYVWADDTTWNGVGGNSFATYIYNDGNDGNGGGTCGSLTWNEDYNLVSWSAAQCVGTHDKCNTSPGFTGSIPIGTSGGGANTYYQGNSGVTLVPIQTSSAAKVSGVNGLTYWNNENDYYNVSRPNPPSMGAEEYASCGINNSFTPCFYNSDCCSGTCTSNVCIGSSPSTVMQSTISGSVKMSGNVNF